MSSGSSRRLRNLLAAAAALASVWLAGAANWPRG